MCPYQETDQCNTHGGHGNPAVPKQGLADEDGQKLGITPTHGSTNTYTAGWE